MIVDGKLPKNEAYLKFIEHFKNFWYEEDSIAIDSLCIEWNYEYGNWIITI